LKEKLFGIKKCFFFSLSSIVGDNFLQKKMPKRLFLRRKLFFGMDDDTIFETNLKKVKKK